MSAEEGVNKRLDRAWADARRTDKVFNLLAVLSRGLPVAVGLIVDGKVIRGVISPDEALIEAATAAVLRPLEAFAPDWDPDLRAAYADAFTRQAEGDAEQRAKDREMANRYMDQATRPVIDEIKADGVSAFYRELIGPPTVVIGQARMEGEGGPVSIEVMSVRRDAISAWWFLDSEDGPLVNYGPSSD